MNVRAFAQAILDHDPVHVDPTCVDAVQLGGLAAPLTFVLHFQERVTVYRDPGRGRGGRQLGAAAG